MPPREQLPEQQPEFSVSDAERVIGHFDTSRDREPWESETIAKRIDDRQKTIKNGNNITLLELYDYNIDHAKLTAVNTLKKAKQENRELTPEEEQLVIQAHMRISLRESLAKAMERTLRLYDAFEEAKKMGMKPLPEEERIVTQNLQALVRLSETRVHQARTLVLEKDEGHRRVLQREAVATDNEIQQILAAYDERSLLRRFVEGKDQEGANREGVLPIITVLSDMFDRRYRELSNEQMEIARMGTQEYVRATEERIASAKEKVVTLYKERFPSSNRDVAFGKIPEKIRSELLKDLGLSASLEIDQKLLERAKDQPFRKLFDELNEEKKKNLDWFLHVTKTMGEFQISRSRLGAIRHHFDQGYYFSGSIEKRREEKASPDLVKTWDEELLLKQKRGLTTIRGHIDDVDKNVAGKGILRQLEDSWNKDGRLFIGHMADAIVQLESGFLPTETLRSRVREYLAGSLYDALNWPRNEQGNPVEWEKLTDADKERIKTRQKSLLDAVKTFRGEKPEEDPIAQVRESVDVAQFLLDHRDDYNPAELLDDTTLSQGDIIYERITPQNIEAMIKQHGARKVYQKAYMQLDEDWNEYSEQAGKLLTDFHDTIGAHIEWADVFREFGDKQMGIAGMLLKLAAILGIAGIGVSVIGVRRLARGAGKAVKVTSKVPRLLKGIRLSRRAAGAAGVALDAGIVALLLTQKPSTEEEEIENAIEVLTAEHTSGPEKGKLIHPQLSRYREYFADILHNRLEIIRLRNVLHGVSDDLRKNNADQALIKRTEELEKTANQLNNRLWHAFKLARTDDQRRVFGTTRGVSVDTMNTEEWKAIHEDAERVIREPSLEKLLPKEGPTLEEESVQFQDDVMTLLREAGYLGAEEI
jgi:hypothetical protein